MQKVRAEEASIDQNAGEVENVQLSSDSSELKTTETQQSQEVVLTDEELTDLVLLQEEQRVYTTVQTYTIETAQSHNDFDCSVCHNAHASSSPRLITASSTSELCLSCHYALLEESREGSNCDPESYDCSICHDIHNATITYSAEETISPETSLSAEQTQQNQTSTVGEVTEPVKDTESTTVTEPTDTQTTTEDEPTTEASPNQIGEPTEEMKTTESLTTEGP